MDPSRKASQGYADEQGIPDGSSTETYAAMRLAINNWRWQGMPFIFAQVSAWHVVRVRLRFNLNARLVFSFQKVTNSMWQQTVVISISRTGRDTRDEFENSWFGDTDSPVKMHFNYSTTFAHTPEAYERLILDAMVGDILFIRGDETEASWKLVTPVLKHWEACGNKGSRNMRPALGALPSECLLSERGHQWRRSGYPARLIVN